MATMLEVAKLAGVSKATVSRVLTGNGYVGGVPNGTQIWSEVGKGNFGPLHGAWVPWYNVHKMFAGLRERMALAQVPEVFAGAPIGFIAAGLLSLAFMGFAGLKIA